MRLDSNASLAGGEASNFFKLAETVGSGITANNDQGNIVLAGRAAEFLGRLDLLFLPVLAC